MPLAVRHSRPARFTPSPGLLAALVWSVLLVFAAPAGAEPEPASARAARTPAWFADPIASAADQLLLLRLVGGDRVERVVRRSAAEGLQLLNDFDRADVHWQRLATLYRRQGAVDDYLATQHARTEVAFFKGDFDAAMRYKRIELSVARRYRVPLAEARAESGIGVIYRRRGRLDLAMSHFERALELRRAIGDRFGEAETLSQMASAQRNKGDYSRALDLLLKAVDIRKTLGEYSRIDLTYRALGVLYREVEDYTQAQSALEMAQQYAQKLGDPLTLSPVLGSLAALYNDRGEPNQALIMARRALEIDERYGNRSGVALSTLEAGRAAIELRQFDDAEASLARALELAAAMRQTFVGARAQLYLALVAEQRGAFDDAEVLLDGAVLEFSTEDAKPFLLQAWAAQERIYVTRAQWPAAAQLAQKRAALREELLGVQSSRRLAGLTAEFEQQQQQQRIALLTKDNQIQALQLQRERLRGYLGIALLVGLSGWLAWIARRYRTERRLNTALTARNAEIAAQREQLSAANIALEHQAKELYRAAISDPLTGIFNRGHLLAKIRECIEVASADRTEVALLMTDFDYFKTVNDRYGHLFGDRVLAAGVERIQLALRGTDFFGRYGGEELLVVLPRTDLDTAVVVAERLRRSIAEALDVVDGVATGLTMSVGVAVLALCPARTMEALVSAADKALYAAKDAGRNRVSAQRASDAVVVDMTSARHG